MPRASILASQCVSPRDSFRAVGLNSQRPFSFRFCTTAGWHVHFSRLWFRLMFRRFLSLPSPMEYDRFRDIVPMALGLQNPKAINNAKQEQNEQWSIPDVGITFLKLFWP